MAVMMKNVHLLYFTIIFPCIFLEIPSLLKYFYYKFVLTLTIIIFLCHSHIPETSNNSFLESIIFITASLPGTSQAGIMFG